MEIPIKIVCNGIAYEVAVAPRTLLADLLRSHLGSKGTHSGCEHGVCGACTVLVDGQPMRSCLMLAVQANGRTIETVESLENPDGSLNSLQVSFQKHHALQCGFCTSGILMSLTALFRQVETPNDKEIRDFLQGHICRCTGFQQIIEASLEESGRKSGEIS